jgi:hypothetical protein
VYSTRDLLRELSRIYARDPRPVSPERILELAASSYATRADRRPTTAKKRRAHEFQSAYRALTRRAARLSGRTTRAVLSDCAERSSTINAYARITGDAVAHAAARLARSRRALGPDGVFAIVDSFARRHARAEGASCDPPQRTGAKRVFDELLALSVKTRDGL